MAAINRVTVEGHIGRDCETRTFQNGTVMVTFSIAHKETYKDSKGETVTNTSWFKIKKTGRDGLLAYAQRFYVKGQALTVDGILKTNEYQNSDGVKVTETFIDITRGDTSLHGDIKGLKDSAQPAAPQRAPAQRSPQPAQQSSSQPAQEPAYAGDYDFSDPFA